jgi:hypothetical protein
VLHDKPIMMEATRDNVEIEIALQYNDSYSETVFSFANNINTVDGGSHLSGFRTSLTRTINAIGQSARPLQGHEGKPERRRRARGLVAVVSVKLPQPQFEGQTKGKLNSDIAGTVQAFVNERLGAFLEQNPPIAKRIINKAIEASRAPRGRPQGPRPDPPQGRARRRRPARQAGRLLERNPSAANSTWSRARAPAAPPSRAAIAASRPSCRSRARSSTSKRRATTRCWATRKSAP